MLQGIGSLVADDDIRVERLDDIQLLGSHGCFRSITDPEFATDVVDVRFRRADADDQLFRDLSVR
jgi:hypothetical protein